MSITAQQNLIDGIYSAISTAIGLANPSGQLIDVYELEAPQDSSLPVCTFQLISDVVTHNITDCKWSDGILQIDFFGNKRLGSKVLRTISDTLFTDMVNSTLTVAGGVSARITGTESGVVTIEENIIHIRQEYNLLIV